MSSGQETGNLLGIDVDLGLGLLGEFCPVQWPKKDPLGQQGGESFQGPEMEEGERGQAEHPLGPNTKATLSGGWPLWQQGQQGCQENASLL